MVTKPLHLYDLPNVLRIYNTRELSHVPTDDHCWVCWRDYGTFERGEKPCIALQLKSCGHCVGSECFKILCQNGTEECQLCGQPICVIQDPVPGFVRWLVSSIWFTKEIDCAVRTIQKDKRRMRRHESLMQNLFRGGLSRKRGYELWGHLVNSVRVIVTWAALSLAGVQTLFSALGWLLDMRYPELFLLKKIIGFHALWGYQVLAIIFDFAVTIRWCVCVELGLNTRSGRWIGKLSILRAFTVLLTWKWCIGFLAAYVLTYSFLVASLIVCGSWKRKEILGC